LYCILASAVVRATKLSRIISSRRSLHWLEIKERIDYKILSLTYKVLTTTEPSLGCPTGMSEGLKIYRWTLFISFLFFINTPHSAAVQWMAIKCILEVWS